MAKGSDKLEQELIATAKEKTGHDVEGWMGIIGASGLTKTNELIKWLKEQHKLNHMQATFLVGIYFNDGKPVYDYPVMFEKLFDGKAALRPLYDTLSGQIKQRISDAEFIPTKTYISIEGDKIFACATLTKDSIRVGVDLGDLPFDEYVQKAKGLGAMPNLTHMIEIRSGNEVSDKMIDYVQQAYQRVHKK